MLDRRMFLGTLAVPLLGYQRTGGELSFSLSGAIRCARESRKITPKLMIVGGQEFALVRKAGKLGIDGEVAQFMDAVPAFQGAVHKRIADLLQNRINELMSQGKLGFQPGENPDKVRARYERQATLLTDKIGSGYDRLRSLHVLLYPREQPAPGGQWALLDRLVAKQQAAQQAERRKTKGNSGGGAQKSAQPGDNTHDEQPDEGTDFDVDFDDAFFYSTGISFDTFVNGLAVAGAAVVIALALGDPAISSMLLTGAVTGAAAGIAVGTYVTSETIRRWGESLKPYLPFAE